MPDTPEEERGRVAAQVGAMPVRRVMPAVRVATPLEKEAWVEAGPAEAPEMVVRAATTEEAAMADTPAIRMVERAQAARAGAG